MNKQDKFINWLCGEGEFPYFKEEDMPKIPKVEIPSSDDKYANITADNEDVYDKELASFQG